MLSINSRGELKTNRYARHTFLENFLIVPEFKFLSVTPIHFYPKRY